MEALCYYKKDSYCGSFIHTQTPTHSICTTRQPWRKSISVHTLPLSMAVCHQPALPVIVLGAQLQLWPGNFVHTSRGVARCCNSVPLTGNWGLSLTVYTSKMTYLSLVLAGNRNLRLRPVLYGWQSVCPPSTGPLQLLLSTLPKAYRAESL